MNVCGVAGILSLNSPFGPERLEFAKQVCDNLLIGLEGRGTDATGIAQIRSDADNYTYRIYKQPVKASEFIKDEAYKATFGPDANVIFLHTRAKTAGDAKENKNNHPHYNKVTGNVQVHNGVISMHEFLKNQHELKCDGECDSEVLMRMIEKFGFRKGLSKVDGSAAIAFSHAASRHVSLYCSGNPLVLAYVPQADVYVFASTMHILNDAMGQRETQTFNGLKMAKFTRFFEYYSMELDDETKVLFNMRKQKVSIERKISMDKTRFNSYKGKHYGDNLHLYNDDAYSRLSYDDLGDYPVRYVLPKKKEETSIETIHHDTQWDSPETVSTAMKLGFTEDEIKTYFKTKFPNTTYADDLLTEYKENAKLEEREDAHYFRRAWKTCMQDPETFVDDVTQMGYEPLQIQTFLESQKVPANQIEKAMSDLQAEEALWQDEQHYMDDRGMY